SRIDSPTVMAGNVMWNITVMTNCHRDRSSRLMSTLRSGVEYGRVRGRLGEPRQGGGADGEQGDDDHLYGFDGGEGVRGVVLGASEVERAEGGDAERQAALLQGDQYAAAD